jgi:hypothetical protein
MVANQLANAADVIDALGGVAAVAELTHTSYRAAHNWKARGLFPPKTHLVMTQALHAQGISAAASLWRMVEAAE